ncbi:hypothetical protein MF271_05000 [Deinococcus sp. KNUC1210]|uniref:hypothetical protein n=1 Tax=Deinococcus sp. KNUC1210 TaxID=2917691 RepID=UPI001EEFA313|nr:hypothetical protein [Deinococcus sp. KNUC1210]ULH15993.1 hypothetical protein MF271_05000 [Deinococcus sp. KNUC1210]
MTTWAALGKQGADLQQGVSVDLTKLMLELWQRLKDGKSPDRPLSAIETVARLAGFESFEAGATQQQRELIGAAALDRPLLDAAVTVGKQRGLIVRERALAVLAEYSEAMVSPYARLAASVLVNDSIRTGTRASGTYHGATRKEFVRIREPLQPRAHSSLEGTVIGIDELFDIGGYMVYGPGDPALPLSERAWCGHVLKFLP